MQAVLLRRVVDRSGSGWTSAEEKPWYLKVYCPDWKAVQLFATSRSRYVQQALELSTKRYLANIGVGKVELVRSHVGSSEEIQNVNQRRQQRKHGALDLDRRTTDGLCSKLRDL